MTVSVAASLQRGESLGIWMPSARSENSMASKPSDAIRVKSSARRFGVGIFVTLPDPSNVRPIIQDQPKMGPQCIQPILCS